MKTKQRVYRPSNWVCRRCGHTNPMYNPNRKRREIQKCCKRCGNENHIGQAYPINIK